MTETTSNRRARATARLRARALRGALLATTAIVAVTVLPVLTDLAGQDAGRALAAGGRGGNGSSTSGGADSAIYAGGNAQDQNTGLIGGGGGGAGATGGDGGDAYSGASGGSGGASAGAAGGTGGSSSHSGAGGGGGAHGYVDTSGALPTTDVTGGAGGDGGNGSDSSTAGSGGGGGAGAFGAAVSGISGVFSFDKNATGGAGGAGGDGGSAGTSVNIGGGYGGSGGRGLSLALDGNTTLTVSGTLRGGQGGDGGDSDKRSGGGGAGGAGLYATSGSSRLTLTVQGTIEGGQGGNRGQGVATPAGLGGAGIYTSNADITLESGSHVSGGADGDNHSSHGMAISVGAGYDSSSIIFGSGVTDSASVLDGSLYIRDASSTLILGQTNDIVVSNAIGGAGMLAKMGSDVLTLSGSNTFSGGLFINEGTVAIQGGSALYDYGRVTLGDRAGVTLRVEASETIGGLSGGGSQGGEVVIAGAQSLTVGGGDTNGTFEGIVSGAGSLVKTGLGTLTLTGANTYSGGTTIAAGTLVGTTTSLSGNIVNDAELRFDQTSAGIYAGVISGAGALAKSGAGTLTLAGINTYTGGTTIAAGTLIGTTTSLTGNIVNDAALRFDQTSAGIYADVISGAGALAKSGSGSVWLTGANTYTGGTTITGGTLIGDTTSLPGDIVNNATLSFDQTIDGTFAGTISGAGTLTKSGMGTLTLTGANTYSGGTVVNDGTLVGSATSIHGDIDNRGTVVFDQTADATFAGAVTTHSATGGQMVKKGAGQLRLAGTSTLGWHVEDGGLTSSSDHFSGNLNLDAGTNFTFDQTYSGYYFGSISGSGVVRYTGGGLVSLTGDNSAYTGRTDIASAVAVNGVLGGTIDILSGGTLKGNGRVGDTTLAAGATIAPGYMSTIYISIPRIGAGIAGAAAETALDALASPVPSNSIGHLSVAGDLTFAPGSTYEVEIGSNGTNDRIDVSGTAHLGGAGVKVVALDPTASYQQGQTYTILAASTLDGRFAPAFVPGSAFLDASLAYSPTTVKLVLATAATPSHPLFGAAAETQNQRAAAAGLDGLDQTAGSGSLALYNAVLFSPTYADARFAFDQLSGEVHASAEGALMESAGAISASVLDRLDAAFAEGPGAASTGAATRLGQTGIDAWISGFGAFAETDATTETAKAERDAGGVLVGADGLATETLRIGLMAGYGQTSLDVAGRGSSAGIDSTYLGLYAGTSLGPVRLKGGAAYGWNEADTTREVAFGAFRDRLTARYDSGTAQVFGEASTRFNLAPGTHLDPFARLAYVSLDTEGFAETGGAAALHGGGGTVEETVSTLGLSGATLLPVGPSGLAATASLGWRHVYGDVTPDATLAFASDPAFTVSGAPIARDAAVVEAGFALPLAPAADLSLSYAGQFGEGLQDNGVKARFQVKF